MFSLVSLLLMESLTFHPILPEVTLTLPTYKELRAREICTMATDAGLDCRWAVSHLLTENGALSEIIHGDNGCSAGLPQWNVCIHEGIKVKRWFALHPEWKDWRYQVSFYLQEMKRRKEKYGSLEQAIVSWNPRAPWYLERVKKNLALADSLL